MAEFYRLDDTNRGGDASTMLAAAALANNNNGFGGMGNPMALAFMFPFIMPFVLPFMNMMYGGNGWGNLGGGNYGGAGFISNQLNNDAGRQLIMQAVQGNASAIDRLANILNTTHDQIQQGICSLNTSVLNVGNNVNMTGMQIINAMQSGNSALQSSIAQGLAGILAQMNSNSKDEAMAHCQQTYNLTETFNRGFLALDNKIDAMESSRKDREIAALTAQVAKLESQNFTAGAIQQAVSPVLGQLAGLREEVESIKRCQPPTITLPNNQYTAVPTLVANAGADFIASYWANRLSGATQGATDTTTPAAQAVR